VTQVPTKAEKEGGFNKEGYGTEKARIIGLAMKKLTALIAEEKVALIFINQLRQKIGAMAFADQYTTSGGKAIGFAASTRVRLTKISKIKNKDNDVIGEELEAHMIKNRLGPPYRKVRFKVYFDRGIDDLDSWLDFLKKKDVISGTAAKYEFVDEHGEVHNFSRGEWPRFAAANPLVRTSVYNRMCEAMVTSYRSDIDPDSIVVESVEGQEEE
jgi:hypothetical protein